MDTNRNFLLMTCIASLLLCVTAASAQTIYKQVDPSGRVVFTDRPSPEARVVGSYGNARPVSRHENDAEAGAEPMRGQAVAGDIRPVAQSASSAAPESRTFPEIRTAQDFRGIATTESPSMAAPKAVTRPMFANDVERAVATYTPLQSPLALHADATEAARRARHDEMNKSPAPGVLIVKQVPREHEPIAAQEGISWFYVLWATSFFILAAGLLYVGFQTLRLILRGAFPRWELGLA